MEKISAKYVDNLIDNDEVPELTEEDFARMVPFFSLPQEQQERLLSLKREPFEIRHTVGLSPEVVSAFRQRGGDWQKEMDDVLLNWLRDHAA